MFKVVRFPHVNANHSLYSTGNRTDNTTLQSAKCGPGWTFRMNLAGASNGYGVVTFTVAASIELDDASLKLLFGRHLTVTTMWASALHGVPALIGTKLVEVPIKPAGERITTQVAKWTGRGSVLLEPSGLFHRRECCRHGRALPSRRVI